MSYGATATPSTVEHESFGNTKMTIATFGNLTDTGMVWTSNIPSVVGYWFQTTDATGTQANEGVDVSLIAASTGQFRFTYGETNKQGKLYVLSLT